MLPAANRSGSHRLRWRVVAGADPSWDARMRPGSHASPRHIGRRGHPWRPDARAVHAFPEIIPQNSASKPYDGRPRPSYLFVVTRAAQWDGVVRHTPGAPAL